MQGVWHDRRDRYSEERSALLQPSPGDEAPARNRIEMYQIGG
jgi:hypothetical protein